MAKKKKKKKSTRKKVSELVLCDAAMDGDVATVKRCLRGGVKAAATLGTGGRISGFNRYCLPKDAKSEPDIGTCAFLLSLERGHHEVAVLLIEAQFREWLYAPWTDQAQATALAGLATKNNNTGLGAILPPDLVDMVASYLSVSLQHMGKALQYWAGLRRDRVSSVAFRFAENAQKYKLGMYGHRDEASHVHVNSVMVAFGLHHVEFPNPPA